jgi:hypothetical protein
LVEILTEVNGRGLDEDLTVFFRHNAEIVIANKTYGYEINFEKNAKNMLSTLILKI